MVGILIFLVLAVGGGASFAAESAVPGDVLYGVKTQFNEQVRAMAAVGAEADAKWEARLAERRLEEAAKLEAEGKLDAAVAAELNAAFGLHAEKAIEIAQTVTADEFNDINLEDEETTLEAEIAARLQAAAEAHADLFRVAVGDVNSDGSADAAAEAGAETKAEVRAFVLPHVLEKAGAMIQAARDKATPKLMEAKATVDANADASLKTDTNAAVKAETGARGGASVEGGASADVEIGL